MHVVFAVRTIPTEIVSQSIVNGRWRYGTVLEILSTLWSFNCVRWRNDECVKEMQISSTACAMRWIAKGFMDIKIRIYICRYLKLWVQAVKLLSECWSRYIEKSQRSVKMDEWKRRRFLHEGGALIYMDARRATVNFVVEIRPLVNEASQ